MKYRVWNKDESGTIDGTSYACEDFPSVVRRTIQLLRENPNAECQESETGDDGTWRKVDVFRGR